jgi:hypothetical protein
VVTGKYAAMSTIRHPRASGGPVFEKAGFPLARE